MAASIRVAGNPSQINLGCVAYGIAKAAQIGWTITVNGTLLTTIDHYGFRFTFTPTVAATGAFVQIRDGAPVVATAGPFDFVTGIPCANLAPTAPVLTATPDGLGGVLLAWTDAIAVDADWPLTGYTLRRRKAPGANGIAAPLNQTDEKTWDVLPYGVLEVLDSTAEYDNTWLTPVPGERYAYDVIATTDLGTSISNEVAVDINQLGVTLDRIRWRV